MTLLEALKDLLVMLFIVLVLGFILGPRHRIGVRPDPSTKPPSGRAPPPPPG